MEVECKNCELKFEKANCEIKNTNNNFCSKSCAAKYNNKVFPKRMKAKKCKVCKELIFSKYTYCDKCISEGKHLASGTYLIDLTLGDYLKDRRKDANRYNGIRKHAINVMKNEKQVCKECGYDKHVECCHIKAIKDFDLNTYVRKINSKDNLILLCPNCHWEFDHNIITLT